MKKLFLIIALVSLSNLGFAQSLTTNPKISKPKQYELANSPADDDTYRKVQHAIIAAAVQFMAKHKHPPIPTPIPVPVLDMNGEVVDVSVMGIEGPNGWEPLYLIVPVTSQVETSDYIDLIQSEGFKGLANAYVQGDMTEVELRQALGL